MCHHSFCFEMFRASCFRNPVANIRYLFHAHPRTFASVPVPSGHHCGERGSEEEYLKRDKHGNRSITDLMHLILIKREQRAAGFIDDRTPINMPGSQYEEEKNAESALAHIMRKTEDSVYPEEVMSEGLQEARIEEIKDILPSNSS